MLKVLVSACLLGERVRYDGGTCPVSGEIFNRWDLEGRLVPICPETAGGLPTPRPAAEIIRTGDESGMQETGEVRTRHGDDVTDSFLAGARQALGLARRHGIRIAILKDGSPSCGSTLINDGSFSGRKMPGAGITTRLLRRHGIHVFSEHQIDAAERCLTELERKHGE